MDSVDDIILKQKILQKQREEEENDNDERPRDRKSKENNKGDECIGDGSR